MLGEHGPLPCTPRGIVELLRRNGIELSGAEVCVIGRGTTVGRPLGLLLTRKSENATVTLCHTGTVDVAAHTRRADIVIAAAGRPGLITAEMVKPGAVCVDVGITRTDAGLVGDIDPSVREVASWVAPVPGGVGPMTRAMLLTNVVERAEALAAWRDLGRARGRGTRPEAARPAPGVSGRCCSSRPSSWAGSSSALLGPETWRAGCLVVGGALVLGALLRARADHAAGRAAARTQQGLRRRRHAARRRRHPGPERRRPRRPIAGGDGRAAPGLAG